MLLKTVRPKMIQIVVRKSINSTKELSGLFQIEFDSENNRFFLFRSSMLGTRRWFVDDFKRIWFL